MLLIVYATTIFLTASLLFVVQPMFARMFLPLGIPSGWTPPAAASPIPWLLALLAVAVGLPFFVVSTTSPLLQKWFAGTAHPSAADPYFLYAASNLGSMLGLLGYPALLEPHLRLAEQSRLWAGGYLLLLALTVACAALLWRSPASGLAAADPSGARSTGPSAC